MEQEKEEEWRVVSLIWQPILLFFIASPYHHKSVTILPLLALMHACLHARGVAEGSKKGIL